MPKRKELMEEQEDSDVCAYCLLQNAQQDNKQLLKGFTSSRCLAVTMLTAEISAIFKTSDTHIQNKYL